MSADAGATVEVWPGRPFPLGADWDGAGVNFSLFSEHAEAVDLCLFDADGRETRVPLPECTAQTWHGYLPGCAPGQRYGYRVHGPYAPQEGQRFNPHKLVLDPYAKAIEGDVDWEGPVLPYVADGTPDADLELDEEDSASSMPKCVVVDTDFDWEQDRPPRRAWQDTVIYETHVRGYTKRHAGVREDLRGTYAGLASDAAIAHLVELGITAVELLPVHRGVDESFLHDRGLTNYWNYAPIAYVAPEARYAADPEAHGALREFKGMVKALHARGDRGGPRRGLQPHRRGQPPRPDALLPRGRQRHLLPAVARGPALLHGLHGDGQLARLPPPGHAADDHGLAALLGDRVPRRRLPLRPGLDAGPRALRRRPPARVLRRRSTRTRCCRRSS